MSNHFKATITIEIDAPACNTAQEAYQQALDGISYGDREGAGLTSDGKGRFSYSVIQNQDLPPLKGAPGLWAAIYSELSSEADPHVTCMHHCPTGLASQSRKWHSITRGDSPSRAAELDIQAALFEFDRQIRQATGRSASMSEVASFFTQVESARAKGLPLLVRWQLSRFQTFDSGDKTISVAVGLKPTGT
ncbi:hypothetical protein [Stutzerimonas stutzeri]|uniref:hypothetical protein n=1 Tax=Stutzerimonas stutzeri TaxID=316 RepID=UPI0015E42E78|nr:hypothetical protein [Stutzerimonas stutzeri]MBA1280428.1 hypothetical protein [Stutzerimonas stutzeri]